MSTITVPATYAGIPDATLTVEPDHYGDSYAMTLRVDGRIIARGEGFRPGAASDFGDGDAAAHTAQTFGSFLAHALESSEEDAQDGWSVIAEDAGEWTDALYMMGEDDDDYPACPICGDPIDYCQGHGERAHFTYVADATGQTFVSEAFEARCAEYLR